MMEGGKKTDMDSGGKKGGKSTVFAGKKKNGWAIQLTLEGKDRYSNGRRKEKGGEISAFLASIKKKEKKRKKKRRASRI